MADLHRFGWWMPLVAVCFLSACEFEKLEETNLGIQQNYFLQSLELVESAGVTLQSPNLTPSDVDNAMQKIDQGLEQAFKVEKEFLKKLDVRLPKFYQEVFIPGIEHYRLGVESSNREKQLKGVNLLNRWWQFWGSEKSNIQKTMVNLNG